MTFIFPKKNLSLSHISFYKPVNETPGQFSPTPPHLQVYSLHLQVSVLYLVYTCSPDYHGVIPTHQCTVTPTVAVSSTARQRLNTGESCYTLITGIFISSGLGRHSAAAAAAVAAHFSTSSCVSVVITVSTQPCRFLWLLCKVLSLMDSYQYIHDYQSLWSNL